jgi:hypothetical protein
MRYLERSPRRYGVLFEQLARTPRMAAALLKEDGERTAGDRIYLYGQALRFGLLTFLSEAGRLPLGHKG